MLQCVVVVVSSRFLGCIRAFSFFNKDIVKSTVHPLGEFVEPGHVLQRTVVRRPEAGGTNRMPKAEYD